MPAPDPDLSLRTRRLQLRALRSDDAHALLTIFADPRVMRYWSTRPWTAIEQAHEFVERSTAALRTGDALRLGIELADEAGLIGQCTLFGLANASRRAEVGYALAASAWGQGYMHEALTALLDHGFDALGLHRVEADIDPRNAASARSLERLGFTREGLLRERWIVDGEVSDSAFYGLLSREWRAQGKRQ
jgi:RimJ/RimL family protein N-acetyltransferase